MYNVIKYNFNLVSLFKQLSEIVKYFINKHTNLRGEKGITRRGGLAETRNGQRDEYTFIS